MPFRLLLLEEVASTNDEVKRALEAGELEGLVVRARRQVAGYGRQGRTWTSPEGGLYCSLLLRPQAPPAQLPTLSLVVGLAVRRALAGLAPEVAPRIQVKWPNDVVLSGPFCHPGQAQTPPLALPSERRPPSVILSECGPPFVILSERSESKDPLRRQQGIPQLTPRGILRLRRCASPLRMTAGRPSSAASRSRGTAAGCASASA